MSFSLLMFFLYTMSVLHYPLIFCVQFPFLSTDLGDNWIKSLDCIFQSEKHFEKSNHCDLLPEHVETIEVLAYAQ